MALSAIYLAVEAKNKGAADGLGPIRIVLGGFRADPNEAGTRQLAG